MRQNSRKVIYAAKNPGTYNVNQANTSCSHAESSLTPEQGEQLLSFLKGRNSEPTAHFAGNAQPITWIVDTGASDHMIYDPSTFCSAQPTIGVSPAKLLNGLRRGHSYW